MSQASSQSTRQPPFADDDTADYPPVHDQLRPTTDIVQYAKEYARQKPEVAALWCFGIGFVVGWKLKPW